jgi:hypothetical protein
VFLLLIFLFSSKDDGKLKWESLALACIFGLGFICFWVIIAPYGGYSAAIYNMGHIKYLTDVGRIPIGHQNLGYFDFPGMHLLITTMNQICGLGIFEGCMIFLIVNAVLFSALLYILYAKRLKSNHLALIGMWLTIVGSGVMVDDMRILYPRILGYTFLIAGLIILYRSERASNGAIVPDRVLLLILLGAMTVSYLPISLLVTLVLLSIYVLNRIGRDRVIAFSFSTIILFLVMVISWEIFWTWHMFTNLVNFLPKLTEDLFSGEFLRSILVLAPANAGAIVPLWAIVTRYFCWGLLGIGTLVGLSKLVGMRNLSFSKQVEVGGLLGAIILTAIGLFGTSGGNQFARYLSYAPIFCSPILIGFLSASDGWRKKSLAILTGLIFIMALPCFLVSVNTIMTDTINKNEIATGDFMESHTQNQGKDIGLYFASDVSRSWAYYYVPNVRLNGVSERAYYDEYKFGQEIDRVTTGFRDISHTGEQLKLFVTNEKTYIPYQHLLNIAPDHPVWKELGHSLSSTNMIYVNGYTTLYAN